MRVLGEADQGETQGSSDPTADGRGFPGAKEICNFKDSFFVVVVSLTEV